MTPLTIARAMAASIQRPPEAWRVLDPACGDGNLLLVAVEEMLRAGVSNISDRILGIDVDPRMVSLSRQRLAEKLGVPSDHVRILEADFLELSNAPLLSLPQFDPQRYNVVLSNPPYGRNREYAFFENCATRLATGSELVFLMPLSFLDRIDGLSAIALEGRPLGVTTGHAIVRHTCGNNYVIRSTKEHQENRSSFVVLSGAKLYEVGAGDPAQSEAVVSAKPYSSSQPNEGWLPCLRTGDIRPFHYETGRLYVDYGKHLAHPKELKRFQGPRIVVRRVPIWKDRQLAAAYLEETVLCAGDVLVVRHSSDDAELLQGLCVFLNSPDAAKSIADMRPSVRLRDSFPKVSAKDLNRLLDYAGPSEDALRELSRTSSLAQAQTEGSHGNGKGTSARLIQRVFPIGDVSEASTREKSIRQGHLSTLQFWWARRPMAACRASLFSALVPDPQALDPSDPWLALAEELLPGRGEIGGRLEAFVARLANWTSASDAEILDCARKLIAGASSKRPLVLDSFAGGGSFPVESLRLGLDAIGSDLNPVAVSALRFALECAPIDGDVVLGRFSLICKQMAERLEGAAETLFGGTSKEKPLAFFWCRTFACPNCRATVPLLKDRILSKGASPAIVSMRYAAKSRRFQFSVALNPSPSDLRGAATGTVNGSGALCPHCTFSTSRQRLKEFGRAGAIGEQLYAIRFKRLNGSIGYRAARVKDEQCAQNAKLRRVSGRQTRVVPSEPLDPNGIRHAWAMQYGVQATADLYNRRQGVALLEVLHEMLFGAGDLESKGLISEVERLGLYSLLAFTLNRLAMYNSRHSWWQSSGEFPANMFGRQAIPFVWNYVEIPFSSDAAGGLASASRWVAKAAEHLTRLPRKGRAFQADAASTGMSDKSVDLVTIDPPYYDSVAYSYLADVFYVWMRELMRHVETEMFASPLSPKTEEAIVDRPHKLATAAKGDAHFRRKMSEAFSEIVRILKPGGLAIVMFGHKKIEAWDAIMSPLLAAGLVPLVSWPVHTERMTKFRHGRIDALSSSCIMVCTSRAHGPRKEIEWDAFTRLHGDHLRELAAQFRASKLYGADLLLVMAAPAVARMASYECVLEGSIPISPSRVFHLLPALIEARPGTEDPGGPSPSSKRVPEKGLAVRSQPSRKRRG